MRKLNKRSDIMDNSVEAYACACAASCSCLNMCNSCVCDFDPSQKSSPANSTSMGIQGYNYTQKVDSNQTGVQK